MRFTGLKVCGAKHGVFEKWRHRHARNEVALSKSPPRFEPRAGWSAAKAQLQGLTRFVTNVGLRDGVSKFQQRRRVHGKWRCGFCAGPAHAYREPGQPGPCQDGPDVGSQRPATREALRLFEAYQSVQQSSLAALRADIAQGMADVNAGRVEEMDMASIKTQGRALKKPS
jgi:predicted transcriptional regulator